MSKKKKHIRPLGWARFLVLWIGLSILIHLITATTVDLLSITDLAVSYFVINILRWVLQAVGQAYLLQRLFQRSFRFWVPVTVLSYIIGTVLNNALFASIEFPSTWHWTVPIILMSMPPLILTAVVQWAILRRRVKFAGLWIVATVALILPFLGYVVLSPLATNPTSEFLVSLAYGSSESLLVGLFVLLMAFLTRRHENNMQMGRGDDVQPDIQRLAEPSHEDSAEGTLDKKQSHNRLVHAY